MSDPVKNTLAMIRGMRPRLLPGTFVFVTASDPTEAARLLPTARATFQEQEGLSLIVPASEGAELAMRQITLDINSALDGVGLTAAVSTALAAKGISCNVVAARYHDHLFVPAADAQTALDVLRDLARDTLDE